MSVLAMLSLLGLALFLPALSSNDEDQIDTPADAEQAEEPEEPVNLDTALEPEEPIISEPASEPEPEFLTNTDADVFGTPQADTITTVSDARIFGLEGNDTISANEDGGGAAISGGAGDDILSTNVLMTERSTETEADTLTGGDGTDQFEINLTFPEAGIASGTINIATLTDFDPDTEWLNITTDSTDETGVAFRGLSLSEAEDGSFTDVIATYAALDEEGAETQAVIRLEGVRDLDISRINLSTGDATTSGNDYISSGGVDLDPDATPTISGGLGDDLLLHEGRDDAGPLALDGGEGNDTIIASEIEFSNPSTLDGGAGDDLLITELFTPTTDQTVDTFTTGEGVDTIQIASLFGSDGPADFGLAARVTDFSPDEDMIVIDTSPFGGASASGLGTSFSLTENVAQGFTDVNIRLLDNAGGEVFTGIVRLEGLTGLAATDIAVSVSEGAPEAPAYLYTATSET